MEIKRNEKGNIEFTPEEFANFLCEIGNEITDKLNSRITEHIAITEAANAIIKEMDYIKPEQYRETSENFNPLLYDKPILRNKSLVIKAKIKQ